MRKGISNQELQAIQALFMHEDFSYVLQGRVLLTDFLREPLDFQECCSLLSVFAGKDISQKENLLSWNALQDIFADFPHNVFLILWFLGLLAQLPELEEQRKSITKIEVWHREVHQLPDSLQNLVELEYLWFERGVLPEIPAWIGKLTRLKSLRMPKGVFSSLPKSIGNLQELEELSIWESELPSLPDSIGNLRSLDWLDLERNELKTIPETIGELKKLRHLNLSYNRLRSLPRSILELKNLQKLDLFGNDFSAEYLQMLEQALPDCIIEY